MHIPDGLMTPTIALIGWILAIAFISLAVWNVNRKLDRRAIPTMALLAAGLFTAQMLNFPIGGGTTGHLLGAALAGYLLGPWAGILVMTAVIVVQGLMFGDGGITAMGLNLFNMAIVGSLLGGYIPKMLPKKFANVGVAVTAWTSVMIGAALCAFQLSASYMMSDGTFGISANIAFPTMLLYHGLIGIGESVITVGVVVYLEKIAPDMFWEANKEKVAA